MNGPHDTFVLRNGYEIPCIGFGTWKMPDGQEAIDAINVALDAGYRHFDTAAAYENEESVGKALRRSGIDRSELFVTSKLWASDRGYDSARPHAQQMNNTLAQTRRPTQVQHQPLRANALSGNDSRSASWQAQHQRGLQSRQHASLNSEQRASFRQQLSEQHTEHHEFHRR